MDAAPSALALELELRAVKGAVSLIGLIATVIGTVADGDRRHAVLVRTLENTSSTDSRCRAVQHLVRAVPAVLLTVTPKINIVEFPLIMKNPYAKSMNFFNRKLTSRTKECISHRADRNDTVRSCSWKCRSFRPSSG